MIRISVSFVGEPGSRIEPGCHSRELRVDCGFSGKYREIVLARAFGCDLPGRGVRLDSEFDGAR